MHLTRFTDNSLRVLIYLASNPGERKNITEIAEMCEIPRNHLTKVIHAMAQKGLLETTRGKGGGVMMAKPASDVVVGDVIRTMEGTAEIINCDTPQCPFGPMCDLRTLLRQGQDAFLSTLDNHTIADLIRTA